MRLRTIVRQLAIGSLLTCMSIQQAEAQFVEVPPGTFLTASCLAAAPIVLDVIPSGQQVAIGEVLEFNIKVRSDQAIIGWGLDLDWSTELLQQIDLLIGAQWWTFQSLDGTNLSGVGFPDGVSGINIVLATVQFLTTNPGTGVVSVGITEDDLTEGFAFENRQFAEVQLNSASFSVTAADIPEPSTCVSGVGLAAIWALHLQRRSCRSSCS